MRITHALVCTERLLAYHVPARIKYSLPSCMENYAFVLQNNVPVLEGGDGWWSERGREKERVRERQQESARVTEWECIRSISSPEAYYSYRQFKMLDTNYTRHIVNTWIEIVQKPFPVEQVQILFIQCLGDYVIECHLTTVMLENMPLRKTSIKLYWQYGKPSCTINSSFVKRRSLCSWWLHFAVHLHYIVEFLALN